MAEVDMNKSGIYQILNKIDGKFYIGSAVILRKRFDLHRFNLRRNKHHSPYLQHAWNKYGSDNFEFKILKIIDDKLQLKEIEQGWLDWTKCYEPNIGYNICKDAQNFRLGLKSTKEHVNKIIAANKGKKRTEEQKQKLRELRLGAKLTEKQKQDRRNYRHSEEDKHKISLAAKGRKHIEEAKLKMSEKAKNRKVVFSDEHKKNLSIATKKHWQKINSYPIILNVSI